MTPTTAPPPPGSAWARMYPDAYPVEWFAELGLTALPPGFARFATDAEAAVIAGKSDAGGGARADARPQGGPPVRSSGWPAARPGDRFRLLNGFADFHLGERTAGEVKVWLLLFRDARGEVSRTGQADLARRAGLSVRSVQKAVARLTAAGLLEIVRRGRLGSGPSCYRVVLPVGPPHGEP